MPFKARLEGSSYLPPHEASLPNHAWNLKLLLLPSIYSTTLPARPYFSHCIIYDDIFFYGTPNNDFGIILYTAALTVIGFPRRKQVQQFQQDRCIFHRHIGPGRPAKRHWERQASLPGKHTFLLVTKAFRLQSRMAKSVLANVPTFEMIVRIYPIRQLLFCHLGALDVARVIYAARLQGAVEKQERERFLNPMRDLFTDAELFDLQEMMNDGAAITLWGSDLKRFLERTEDQSCYLDKHQSSAELNLAITAFPAHPFEANSSTRARESWRFKSSLFKEHTITLPGEWEPWAYTPPWLSTGSESYPSERSKLNAPDSSSSLIEIPYDFALENRSYFSRMLIPSPGVLKVMQYGSEDPETPCPCPNYNLQYVNLQESGLVVKQSHSKCWSQDPLVVDGSLHGSWPRRIFKLLYRQTKTIPQNGFTFPRFRYDRYMMQIRADPQGQGTKSAP